MPNRNARLALYLAKIEGTEGVDPTPTPLLNVIELESTFEPDYDNVFKPEALDRVRGPVLGPGDPLTVAGKAVTASRKAFLRGTSAAIGSGNPIELDPWFQAAGMAATYSGGAGVEQVAYTPADSGLVTMTEYYYRDGIQYIVTGIRGEVKLTMVVGGAITVDFNIQGRMATDQDAAVPVNGVFPTLTWPIATDAPTFTINGYTTGVIRSWEHDLGNVIHRRDAIKAVGGIQGWRIVKRNPIFKVTLEEDTHTQVNWTTLRDSRTPIAISWQVGATQYNRIAFATARAFIRKIVPTNDNGLALVTLEGDLRGAPAYSLTVN